MNSVTFISTHPKDSSSWLGVNGVTATVLLSLVVAISVANMDRRCAVVSAVGGIFTFGVLLLWSYWAHRIAHMSFTKRVPFLRTHTLMHHDDEMGTRFYAETMMYEIVGNLFIVGGLLLWYVPFLNRRIVVFFALSYVLIHNVTYHLPTYAGFHRRHHADPSCNYGISCIDTLFNTASTEDPPEDITHFLYVTIPLAVVMLLFIQRAYMGKHKIFDLHLQSITKTITEFSSKL